MKKRSSQVSLFLIFIFLSLLFYFAFQDNLLKPISRPLQNVFSPVFSAVYSGFSGITNFDSASKVKELKDENAALTEKLVDQTKLQQDNQALRDQFETVTPKSTILVPAQIVGAPGFIPGISFPETFTINVGSKDGIKAGEAVILKNNLIGRVTKVNYYLSSVLLVTNENSSFTATTMETNALGIVKGQGGGEMILDNVLLSDNLKAGDIVLTKGDVGASGAGFMPGLIVGKIVSISKNASDLFQKAKIESLVDFSKIDTVFVVNSQ
ncbi:rod shape-determining protein MreC [Patescibacteria group bacterium]|nr:rod shape-determining protein MreC [Patescibacteria group bacterium]